MRSPEPILAGHLFAPLNDELVILLRGLTADEWNAPTVCAGWSVKDVAAHLLDTTLRRLSMHRDAHAPPLPPDAFANGLAGFVNGMNARGVEYWRRASPAMLIDLHERFGHEMAEFLSSLDPFAPAKWAVSWAGDEESPTWFDVARELTERWLHQQQIRDATCRPALYERRYLGPVLDAFVRALPHTYRDVAAPDGTIVTLNITGEAGGRWSLVRQSSRWTLMLDAEGPTTFIEMSEDTAWRVFTKGLTREEAVARTRIEGNAAYGDAALGMIAIVA